MNYSELKETIYHRKSHRKYSKEPVSLEMIEKIKAFFGEVKPLYDGIRVRLEIVDRKNVRSLMPWITEKVVAIFSEEAEGYLENAGFVLQQVDLYIQSLGLGSCWIGMASVNTETESSIGEGLKFVILLAFGNTAENFRSSDEDFKRKPLDEISSSQDERLIPARLAPSSINSQPWYFVKEGEKFHTYQLSLVRTKNLTKMNRIDVGIALSHMYVAYPESFATESLLTKPGIDKAAYVLTFQI